MRHRQLWLMDGWKLFRSHIGLQILIPKAPTDAGPNHRDIPSIEPLCSCRGGALVRGDASGTCDSRGGLRSLEPRSVSIVRKYGCSVNQWPCQYRYNVLGPTVHVPTCNGFAAVWRLACTVCSRWSAASTPRPPTQRLHAKRKQICVRSWQQQRPNWLLFSRPRRRRQRKSVLQTTVQAQYNQRNKRLLLPCLRRSSTSWWP